MLRILRRFPKRKYIIFISLSSLFIYLLFGQTKKPVRIDKQVLYNLMEETLVMEHYTLNPIHVRDGDCTIEYANAHRLQQDHPCVLKLIRDKFLNDPAPQQSPLNLTYPNQKDQSAGQVTAVLRLLDNMTGGFYIESGAADGESFSNTIYLERFMNWTGLLIEPEPVSYQNLKQKNRKSWTVPACLSLEKYPTEVAFDRDEILGKIRGEKASQSVLDVGKIVNVQCFPFYSILLAHKQRRVDFFSLDVEGHELLVLKTIPWHKVDVRIIVVEWEHVEEGYYAIVDYMKEQGYVNFGNIATPYARDVVFVKDFLQDLRTDYDYHNE